MELYRFVYYTLAWGVTVAVLGFVLFPWLIPAYKLWHGNKPIDEELREELLQRSWYAGWVVGVAAIVLLMLDYLTVDQLSFPSGPIHIIYLLAFVSFAAWMMMYFFSLEDFIQGLFLAVLYLYIPAALLYFFSNWNPLYQYVLTWLIEPKA